MSDVHVCLPLQRAPSAPSSRTPPSRPPRPTVTHTSSVDPITRPSQGTYAPLSATSREQPAVYQEISVPKSGAKKSVLKQSSSGEGAMSTSGGGVYQALGNNKDAPSTYAVSHNCLLVSSHLSIATVCCLSSAESQHWSRRWCTE